MIWRVGDQVPHFEVETVDGAHVRYVDIWQRQQLLLVCVQEHAAGSRTAWLEHLVHRANDLSAAETALVVTDQKIPGAPTAGVTIADRWGEILFLWSGDGPDGDWPSVDDVIASVNHIRMRCPECEGETR